MNLGGGAGEVDTLRPVRGILQSRQDCIKSRASLVAQMVKNHPVMLETWFDPWAGKIPWRREWLSTPVFWHGEFHELYNCPGGHKESDITELLSFHFTSAFFMVQLSHPCMTTGKTITLTVQTFVDKVMALCSGHMPTTEVRTTSPFVAWVYVTDRNIGGLLNKRLRVGNYQKPYIRSLWREPACSCDF